MVLVLVLYVSIGWEDNKKSKIFIFLPTFLILYLSLKRTAQRVNTFPIYFIYWTKIHSVFFDNERYETFHAEKTAGKRNNFVWRGQSVDNFVFRPAKNTDLFKCLQNTESLLEFHQQMLPTNGSMGVLISGGIKAFLKRASL